MVSEAVSTEKPYDSLMIAEAIRRATEKLSFSEILQKASTTKRSEIIFLELLALERSGWKPPETIEDLKKKTSDKLFYDSGQLLMEILNTQKFSGDNVSRLRQSFNAYNNVFNMKTTIYEDGTIEHRLE